MTTYVAHTVAAGETLSKIAQNYYGDASAWKRIAKASAIFSPYVITVGQRLLVPDPLAEVTVTAPKLQEPGLPDTYNGIPIPTFEEITVQAEKVSPWFLVAILIGGMLILDSEGKL